MSTPWIVASVLQWVVLGALTVLVLSLIRQLGLIAIRLNPSVGLDLDEGPGPGSELVAQEVPLLDGRTETLGGERAQPLLVVFLSPDCSICNAVVANVVTLTRAYSSSDLSVLVVLSATPRTAREYIRNHELSKLPVALKQNFPANHNINSTPFAMSLTTEGVVAARGVPNALEHLEEMAAKAASRPTDPVPVPSLDEMDREMTIEITQRGESWPSQSTSS